MGNPKILSALPQVLETPEARREIAVGRAAEYGELDDLFGFYAR
jgi:hypothetical protein